MEILISYHSYSGLTFACLAKEVVELSKGECGVLAFDARRHGTERSTVTNSRYTP
jgi:protein phosphatase methylesterase 1